MANASKIMGSELNNNAISIEALKSSDVGDMVLFLDEYGGLALFKVESRIGTRGAKGGTALTLSDMVGDVKMQLPTTNTLPDGVIMVRKVLSGVNVRTIRKLAPKAGESVIVTDAPAEIALPELLAEATHDMTLLPTEPVVCGEPSDFAQFAQCGPAEDISELIAEIVTISE